MPVLRAALLALALLGFYGIGAPIQALAVRRGWALAERIPVLFHRTMCRILRIRVVFEGTTAPDRPLLVIANHVSWVDIMALSTGLPVCFLAKREMRSWPVFGTFAVLQGSVFVDRAKVSDLPQVNIAIARTLTAGKRIVVFAESTTSDGSGLMRFRSSHFGAAQAYLTMVPGAASLAVQPAALSYTAAHAGPHGVAWYGDMTLAPHVWQMLRTGPFQCRIRFGAPLAFTRASARKDVAQAMEDAVRALLAEPGPSNTSAA